VVRVFRVTASGPLAIRIIWGRCCNFLLDPWEYPHLNIPIGFPKDGHSVQVIPQKLLPRVLWLIVEREGHVSNHWADYLHTWISSINGLTLCPWYILHTGCCSTPPPSLVGEARLSGVRPPPCWKSRCWWSWDLCKTQCPALLAAFVHCGVPGSGTVSFGNHGHLKCELQVGEQKLGLGSFPGPKDHPSLLNHHAHAHAHARFISTTTKQLPDSATNTDYVTLTLTAFTTTPICKIAPAWDWCQTPVSYTGIPARMARKSANFES
jgi:hypothetical protein